MSLKWKMIVAISCAVVIAAWAGLFIVAKAQHTKYLEALGAEALLREQYKVSDGKLKKENSALDAANKILEKAKKAAEQDKLKEQAGREKAEADLIAEKAKTATLTDNDLSGAINLRIGAGQSRPTAAGNFSFTRPGTETTLNIFKDGETAASNYESAQREIKKTEVAAKDCEDQRANDGLQIGNLKDLLGKSNAGWTKADEARISLERSILGLKIKTFTAGVGSGGLLVFFLHLAGVIK